DTAEVTVRHGRVTAFDELPGAGGVDAGSVVLLGREEGARQLRTLHLGEPVGVGYRLVGRGPGPLRFAVGGFPIVRDAEPVAGLDTVAVAVRTSAGIADGGRVLYLMALDGAHGEGQTGLTVRELADLMAELGAREAMDLDGGGSSTLVTDDDGAGIVVRNHPSGGAERPVANAIGVFSLG
ncbi:phosphodiester glycosidase family protein, partial [Streptomyces lydicus]